ncbi:MAG: TetR/AcrR family transcriptional regulator [Cyanobacteria bacterium P01_F01_bin.153]
MAKTRQYDEAQVRRGAVQVFLQKGFASTSLVDLEEATGINRRQIYNDLGDKRSVFLAALKDFSRMAGQEFLAPLDREGAAIADIEAILKHLVQCAVSERGRLGCLMCNTAREVVAADAEVNELVSQFFRRIETGYRNALENAQQTGELPEEEEPKQLARLFLSLHISLCVMARSGESVEVLEDAVAAALGRIKSPLTG